MNFTKLTPVQTGIVNSSDDHVKFYQHVNRLASEHLMRQITSINTMSIGGNPICLVKINIDAQQVFINSLPEHLQQEYRCNACKQFMRGVATMAYIDDELNVVPLALVEDLGDLTDLPEILVNAYTNMVKAVKASNSYSVLMLGDIEKSDNIYGSAVAGGWYHLALDTQASSKTNVARFLRQNSKVSTDTLAYGEAQISNLSKVINYYIPFYGLLTNGDLQRAPVGSVKQKDLSAIERFAAIVVSAITARKDGKFTEWLYHHLSTRGMEVIHFKNSVAGKLIEDLINGIDFQKALSTYQSFTDPTKYMRPVRMPSVVEFEKSVKFLEEKGYDVCLPMHIATFDDYLADSEVNIWTRPLDKEIPVKQKGIFDTQREQLGQVRREYGQSGKSLGLQKVSGRFFIEEIQRLKDEIRDVSISRHSCYFIGSAAKPQDENGAKIYEDGRSLRTFRWAEAISVHEFPHLMKNPERILNGAVDLIRGRVGADGLELAFVYRNVEWTHAFNCPIFPDQLIPEIRNEHRRVIEDWCRTNYINTNPDGKVASYADTCAGISLALGMVIRLTLKNGSWLEMEIVSER